MKNLLHICRFEWKNLWRNNTLIILLLVFFGAGIYGIYFGKFEIQKQEDRMATVQEYERQQFDSLLTWVSLDTSIKANQINFRRAVSPTGEGRSKHFTYYVLHHTPPLAGLCLGQRDLFPVYYGLNVTDLARQMNIGELANPMKLLTGNFDLSYVIIFLLPLLIVALFYDLYAKEKEGGTLTLLQSQSVKLSTVLMGKGLLRLLIVLGSATGLLLLGFLLQGISLGQNAGIFFQSLGLIYTYCLFWTAVMAGIIALRKSSATSAIYGLGIWLLLTMISPALLNLFVSAKTPLPNRTDSVHELRTLSGKVWGSPRSFVYDQFYPKYPEYDKGDSINFNQWYYASFTLFDDKANSLNQEYESQVAKRNQLLKKWQWLAPAAMVHENFSSISKTDRESHIRFVKRIHEFHDDLKNTYYPKIFDDENFNKTELMELQAKLEE